MMVSNQVSHCKSMQSWGLLREFEMAQNSVGTNDHEVTNRDAF